MDFFSDPRLHQKQSTTTTTTTSTSNNNNNNIKVKTIPSIQIKTKSHSHSQSHSQPPSTTTRTSTTSTTTRTTTISKTTISKPKPQSKPSTSTFQSIKNTNSSKKQTKKRIIDQPIQRPIKKARWIGSQTSSNLTRLSSSKKNTLLTSDDRSESISINNLDSQSSEESKEAEEETKDHDALIKEENQILDRSNRYVPRPVKPTQTRFSSTHSLLSNSNPISSILSADTLVKQNRSRFKPWFRAGEGHWPFKESDDPKISLVYPAGGQEIFPLLVPKDKEDEYRPLDDLLNVITITLSQYLTPDQSIRFFSEPHPIFAPSLNATNPKHDFRFLNRPKSSHHPHRSSSLQTGGTHHTTSPTPKHDLILKSNEADLSTLPFLKTLSKSIRRQNGSDFIKLVNWYNRVIKHLISQGLIGTQIDQMKGMKMSIWETILGQAYERRIGPKIEMVKEYETWSSNVYGELKPKFVSDLVHLVGLQPGQIFVDLGSGVGNIVMQVVLEAGCVGVGFENMSACCRLAEDQLKEVVGRCQSFWGVSLGHPCLIEADFTKDPRVGEWLKEADVVLVNNQVFTPSLNDSLTLLFLDLKDSTKIISLKPFVPKEFKISERNMNSPLAILDQPQEFEYRSTSVSWTDNGGKFYVTEVNRSRLCEFQKGLSK